MRDNLVVRHLAFVSLLALSACKSSSTPAATAPEPTPAAEPTPTAILEELQNGDTSCLIVLRVGGEQTAIDGDFALCAGGERDATSLIGKPVTFRTEKANVIAASCEGDPECPDSEAVDLVVAIEAAP